MKLLRGGFHFLRIKICLPLQQTIIKHNIRDIRRVISFEKRHSDWEMKEAILQVKL